ncbi:hypothetical protein RB601_001898 [Gaeumannomyces tritici]
MTVKMIPKDDRIFHRLTISLDAELFLFHAKPDKQPCICASELSTMLAASKYQTFILCALYAWQLITAAAYIGPRQCLWNPAGPSLSRSPPGGGEHSIFSSCPTEVDDATSAQKGTWEPWTRLPICSKPTRNGKAPYCIYTHSSLAGSGSGISILTTPSIAAATAPLVDGLDLAWGLPSSSGVFPVAPTGWRKEPDAHVRESRSPPPYEVRPVEGKGMGVVANASIMPGELLFRERPVLVDMMARHWSVDSRQHRAMLDRALARLPPADRAHVKALSYHSKEHIVEGIMKANSFAITLNGVPHSGLYPKIARINHACKPNTYVRYRRSTMELEVVAYREIEPGTELTVSYTPLNILSEDRRQLLGRWGFECTCSLCSADPHIVQASDSNRMRLQDILKGLSDPEFREDFAGGSYDCIVRNDMDEMQNIMFEEGFEAQAGDMAAMDAEFYLAARQWGQARDSATRAVWELRMYAGPDSERTEQAEDFLKRLYNHELRRNQ